MRVKQKVEKLDIYIFPYVYIGRSPNNIVQKKLFRSLIKTTK